MKHSTFCHQSVLLREAVAALAIKEGGVYVDATLGGGGHSREILKHLGENGKLFVFDQDEDAWGNAPNDSRVLLIKENFRYLQRFLRLHGEPQVDGILADLGVSSFQFDTAERGFSTRLDAELDMRMDRRSKLTAKAFLKELDERALQLIFQNYGEVRNARSLAATIVAAREKTPINTVQEFKTVIDSCVKGNPNRYLAQVFQALRIAVNEELEVLKEFLTQVPVCLKPGGRLAVLTFHSLEDKLVKDFVKKGTFEPEVEKDEFGRPIHKHLLRKMKDVLPSQQEMNENPRSRSARLRIAEKMESHD